MKEVSDDLTMRCDTMLTYTILTMTSFSLPLPPPSLLLSSLLPETTDHLGIEFMGKEALLVLHLHESHQHMASYWINIVLCNCLINPGTFQAERNEHTRTPAYLYEVMKRWSESVLSNDETPLSASSVRPLLVSLSY